MTADLTPLDVLRRDGWCKGRAENSLGQLCAIGALSCAGWDLDAEDIVVEVITEQFPERLGWTRDLTSVAQFNDHPDTTLAEVETVFEKAQIRYDERVQS